MAENTALHSARGAKNDEFYTQYSDIEAEMNAYVEFNPDVFRDKTILLPCDDPEWSNFTKYFAANFERFGLKKLISTSYAKSAGSQQLTLFEQESPLFDADKHDTHGKLFTLVQDKDGSGRVDADDIEFSGYLKGDGDFRSAEVRALRDEADIIITNPPFSLFREYVAVLMEHEKRFIIIGNVNAITYKEFFPLIRDNRVWIGASIHSGDRKFHVPADYEIRTSNSGVDSDGRKWVRVAGVRWYTNLDIKQRHEELILVKKYAGHEDEYPKYDNYDAIEVSKVANIPLDYDGVMGVPITFLDKYNPEQFEILDARDIAKSDKQRKKPTLLIKDADSAINGKPKYARIAIRNKHPEL